MANVRRGEVELTLGGRSHRLRLTLNALAEIEAGLGADGLAALGRRLAAGGLRSADLVVMVAATLRAGGTELTDAEVGDLVAADDVPRIAEALAGLLAVNVPDRPRP
jgi:hypothetical protein